MIYISKELSNDLVIPYMFITHMVSYDSIITIPEMMLQMNLSDTPSHRKYLKNSIIQLTEEEYMKSKEVSEGMYDICINYKKYEPGTYYSIELDEISNILNLPIKSNRLNIATYYIILRNTINYYTHVGYTSQYKLMQYAKLSKLTMIKYNKILEDHEIIYIAHSKKKNIHNRYGLYEYKADVIKAAKEAGIWYSNKLNC